MSCFVQSNLSMSFIFVVCIPLLALRVENEALVRESSCAEPNSKFMAVRPNGDFSPEQEK